MLFERTRYLFSMLGSYLSPSTLFAARPTSIILVGANEASSAFETIEVERVGGAQNQANGNGSGNGHGLEKGKERIGVKQWILDSCPSLRRTFTPSWWLWNGHLQTIYSVLGDFTKVDQIDYERTLLRLPDNGTIGLDFVIPPNEDSLSEHANKADNDTPILVMTHGLTGGSHESYVRHILAHVTKPKTLGGLGIRGVVVNFRGCAQTPLTSAQLYSAGHTHDLRSAVSYLHTTYPNAPLLGIGFSLGAGVMARFIGEEGESCVLKAGVVVGTPWDCPGMSARLDATWFSRNAYSKAMGKNILKVWNGHTKNNPSSHLLQPDSRAYSRLDRIAALSSSPLLRATDEVIVSTVGGSPDVFPFKNALEYYSWASPMQKILDIKIPTLCINAFDDPIIGGDLLPIDIFQRSSHAILAIVGGGGHLGWFSGGHPFLSPPRRWLHHPVGDFLSSALAELPSSPSLAKAVTTNEFVGWEVVPLKDGRESERYTWKMVGKGWLEKGVWARVPVGVKA